MYLLSLPLCLEVWVTSAAFTTLASIVIIPQRPSKSEAYGHKSLNKKEVPKASFPGIERGSQLLWPRACLALKPRVSQSERPLSV